VPETVVTDGRVNRSARTRIAVVDALLALINDGNLRPTAREVADRAGVSLRSVYVHFDDVESLFVAASARHIERLQSLLLTCDPEAPLDERVATLVESRRRIYEAGAQVRRAARLQEPFSPALQRAMEYGRRSGRAEIDAVFASELAAVATEQRHRLRAALEVAAGASTWDVLTTNPDVSADDVPVLMGELVHAALSAWGRPPPPTSAGPD
jgi:TetR/AcrR family transcriptional regulator, regulator of autoinduction and epiphytic fitness